MRTILCMAAVALVLMTPGRTRAEIIANPVTGDQAVIPDGLDKAAWDAKYREIVGQGLEQIRRENFEEEAARACEAQYRLREGAP